MKLDPELNAARQAARKNRKLERRSPLFHSAGIVEQIVERWTAARHPALHAACREALAANMAEAHARSFAHTERYMEICHELTSDEQMRAWTLRCTTAGFPKRPHDVADFWYQRVKEALGLDQPCSCGGIWSCGLHQPRRCGSRRTSWTDIALGVAALRDKGNHRPAPMLPRTDCRLDQDR